MCSDFVLCCAANFGAVDREQVVLEVPISMSFEIFLYPFYDSDWVIISTLYMYLFSGQYVVFCV